MIITDGNYKPAGSHRISDLAAPRGLESINNARAALIQAEGQNVRWRDDGSAPTASSGMLLAAGKDFFYTGDLNRLRFIETANGATLNVVLYETADKQR